METVGHCQREIFLSKFLKCPLGEPANTRDDIILADGALPANCAAAQSATHRETFYGTSIGHKVSRCMMWGGPQPGLHHLSPAPLAVQHLSRTHQGHIHSFSSQNEDFERRRPAEQNKTSYRSLSPGKQRVRRGAARPLGGCL